LACTFLCASRNSWSRPGLRYTLTVDRSTIEDRFAANLWYVAMTIKADTLNKLIEAELQHVLDVRVVVHIRGLFVEPYPILRNWDYGAPGEQFPCWVVLADLKSSYCVLRRRLRPAQSKGTYIAAQQRTLIYVNGYGLRLVSTLMDAYFESSAATELPIWRVFKINASGAREPLTNEDTWGATWKHIDQYRKADTESRYDCGHSINYKH
jgi:hypothetical protein